MKWPTVLQVVALIVFLPVIMLFVLGVVAYDTWHELSKAVIDANDERIIRSIERDVVATARRMTKVAAR